mgnify:CR=1 FL=1
MKTLCNDKKYNLLYTNLLSRGVKTMDKKDKIIIVASHIKEDIDTLADVVYNIDNGIVEKIKG